MNKEELKLLKEIAADIKGIAFAQEAIAKESKRIGLK